MSDLQQELTEFFAEYSRRWNSQQYGTLAELWDRDDPSPFYRPMEVEQPLAGWPQLQNYWNPRPGMKFIDGLWNVYVNLRPKLVGPDVAVVLFDLEWDIKGAHSRPQSGTDPGMAVLRRKPEGWRMVAYVEACMHPAAYVRKMFERQARPGFRQFLASQTAEDKAAPGADAGEHLWS
jgi:hypothetical protein